MWVLSPKFGEYSGPENFVLAIRSLIIGYLIGVKQFKAESAGLY